MESKYISFHKLRKIARLSGVKNTQSMSKGMLCKAMGIVRAEHIPKYSLTNTYTLDVTEYWSAARMGKVLNINTGNIFYALKKNRPLKVNGVPHILKRL